MEEEFDLWRLVGVFSRYWKWIVGLGGLAATIALIVSLLVPPQYEATTLIAATRQQYQLQFDSRITTLNDPTQSQPYKAFPELAVSDEVLSQVIAKVTAVLPADQRDVETFRRRLAAKVGADPSLIRLTASASDPQLSQQIAATWGEVYVQYMNDLYQQRASTATFFASQTDEARARLEATEQELIDFQAHNPLNLLNAQLAAKQAALASDLAMGQRIALLIEDARSLQQQLARQAAGATLPLADQVSALYLQVSTLTGQGAVPIQLQVSSGGELGTRTVGEQSVLLESLVKALEDKASEFQQQAKGLEPDIYDLQKQQQATQIDVSRLTRDRDVAQDTYLTLTRKLDEAQVTAQDTSGVVQLASTATVPALPVGPRKAVNTLLGGVVGVLLAMGGVWLAESRRSSRARFQQPALLEPEAAPPVREPNGHSKHQAEQLMRRAGGYSRPEESGIGAVVAVLSPGFEMWYSAD